MLFVPLHSSFSMYKSHGPNSEEPWRDNCTPFASNHTPPLRPLLPRPWPPSSPCSIHTRSLQLSLVRRAMYHRPPPIARSESSSSVLLAAPDDSKALSRSTSPSPRLSPLLPTATLHPPPGSNESNSHAGSLSLKVPEPGTNAGEPAVPTLWGMPLKYVSCVYLQFHVTVPGVLLTPI
jgi:hypothetical protein